MNNKFLRVTKSSLLRAAATLFLLVFVASTVSASSLSLQGQSKGSTNWIASNLQNWQELDYIPCRVFMTAGPFSNQTLTITFPHITGTTPGIQNLSSFTTSSNAVIVSGPTLAAPLSGDWSYTLVVNVTDGNPAFVQFLARLAAGSHLNVGSSLALGGSPQSMGSLQIHKPAAGPGAPDLAVIKSGPASAAAGATITYTLTYTNSSSGTNTARGAQISDVLPPQVSVDPTNISGGSSAGNTIFWDLGDVAPKSGGVITFQATIDSATAVGQSITNFSQILSSENDADYADNSSTWVTLIACTPPTITSNPVGSTNCPGNGVTLSVLATGTSPKYYWRKNGTNIGGATNSSYSIASVSAGDAGSYDVIVSNACGIVTSGATALSVYSVVSASGPVDQAVCLGATPVFATTPSGTGPFNYQWLKDGNAIVGQTNASLLLANVSAADAAVYGVIVTGACGSVTNSAALTVNNPVAISGQPLSSTNCTATPAIFSVGATGTGLSYQWRKGGINISGATNNSYSIASVSAGDAGSYDVMVSGACGSQASSVAVLTVNSPVAISGQPLSLTNCPATPASFSVSATGTGLSYQWRKDGNNISGATNSSYSIASVSASDAGSYDVVVGGTCGSQSSGAAVLTVNSPVAISAEPLSLTNCPATPASFSVSATGTGLGYQWRKDGVNISGATNNTYSIASVMDNDAGSYDVVVSGTCGSQASGAATLFVNTIVSASGPADQTVCPGATPVFTTTPSGTGPFNYQWLLNSNTIASQTNASLTLTNVSAADAGLYGVIVSGACGSVTNFATLTVNSPVAINGQPLSLTNCPATPASFSVSVTGTGLNYQWRKDGVNISGATNSSYSIASVVAGDAGSYDVMVTGTCGSQASSAAVLTVNSPVAISGQPLSLTNCPATPASFNVSATGTGLNYQWRKDGNNISGATNSSYSIASVVAGDAGSYDVLVGGTCGSQASSAAVLTVNSPVAISGQPLSLTNCPATPASFSVSATGTGLSYQWRKGGINISGATNSGYSIASVVAGDAGSYDVLVTGTCGSQASSAAVLALNKPVAIVIAPRSVTNCPASLARFIVGATGTGLSYQWRKDGNSINGATNNTYSIASVSAGDAGSYDVLVSGACGSQTSGAAVLTVNSPVAISGQPLSLTNCPATPASLSVSATGTGLGYQWRKDGVNISGATNNTYSIASVADNDAGSYDVVVSGTCGSQASGAATLFVNTIVSASGPADQTVCPGATPVFTTTPSGTGPFNYQWLLNSNTIAGETNASLTLTNVSAADAGLYGVIVSGACGSVTNFATLTVNSSVAISGQPLSLTNCPATPASFSVGATGTGLSYQWRKDGNNISSATNNSYSIASVVAGDAGSYDVLVSGTCGSQVSSAAMLTVNSPVAISGQPLSLTNCPATPASFSVSATGTGLSYQWRKGGINISGATNSSYSIGSVSAGDAGSYDVLVSGTCGSQASSAAVLALNKPVAIIIAPRSVTNCPASFARFIVGATGTGLSYQWRKDGNNISGATNNSYSIASVVAGDAGSYDVMVTGTCGSQASSAAVLTVNSPVAISGQPLSLTNCPATAASFSVSATGTGLSYQWRKDGNNISGATNNTYSIASVSAADAGSYDVMVTGTCGSQASGAAVLTVNSPVAISGQPLSLTNCPATPASFSVSATGTGLSYQWRKDGNSINGATNSSYSIVSVTANDAGSYDVLVSGTCGSQASGAAVLTVNSPVAISGQPLSLTNCPATAASFSVSATGTGLSYQWRKDGVNISGATNNSYSIASVSAGDAGSYDVMVSGTCGSQASSAAVLTVNSPVAISGQPLSLTNCPATPASFSVSATGTGLSYQWRKGGINISGATNNSYSIASVSAGDAGSYDVMVTGTCGSQASGAAVLTVNSPVAISGQPLSLTNCPATPASFSVSATGTGLSYQWRKGGINISGATNNSYSIASVSSGDAGSYDVMVSGTCGSQASSVAVLTVNSPVAISGQPLSLTNCPATPASFSVSATGTGLSYQWRKGGINIIGATNSTYSIASVVAGDAGSYDVLVTGTCGSQASSAAVLTVNSPVAISGQPLSLTNCPATAASFTVSATGTGLSYQWRKGGINISGATNNTYAIASVAAGDAGSYDVMVTGTCGSQASSAAVLTVNSPVAISGQPLSLTNCPATPASFSVSAAGTGLSYQWRKGGINISGATNNSYSIASVVAGDAGSYDVVVTGTCGSQASSAAVLTVNSPVAISGQPLSLTNCPATPASFSVSATGTGLSYQWRKGGINISGATNNSYSIASVVAGDADSYDVVVTGTCGSQASSAAVLTVNSPVAISGHPLSLTNCPATPASFSVSATGTGLSYQWRKGGINISGATNSTFSIASVVAGDAGSYDVMVTGTCGSQVSGAAVLTVNSPVAISGQPLSLTNCPATPASFSVSATGTGLSYQWRKGGINISGATNNSYSIASVVAGDAGSYDVMVTGTCGSQASSAAVLTVNIPVAISGQPVSLTNCPATAASFSVSATGTGLSYQWRKGGINISGATNNSYSIASVTANNAGSYDVMVTGTCGSQASSAAVLTVNSPVAISGQPLSLTNCPATPASFSVSATGTGLSYQWRKGGINISGATNSTFSIASVVAGDAGSYDVMVSGTCGSQVSSAAVLTVNSPVAISGQPLSLTNCPATAASFSVSATGTGLSYQWRKGGINISGATNNSYSIASVTANNAGSYDVMVTGTCGSQASSAAVLTVNNPVAISGQPLSLTNCPATPASFSVSATGTGLSYQWRKGGINISGATNNTYSIASVSAGDAGSYDVVVSGTCGSQASVAAVLAVNAITAATPMASAVKNIGDSVTFTTLATGPGLFTYVWKKNGTPIAGQTTNSLTLSNIGTNDVGTYTVEVSGRCNVVIISAALTINLPPTVSIVNPTNGAIFVAPASFTVLANAQDVDGTVTNVEFFYGTNDLGAGSLLGLPAGPGGTNSFLTELTNVPAGTYVFTAKATDNDGATGTSVPVSITVLDSPPMSIVSAMRFDPQTGLYKQTVRVSNPTYAAFDAVRIYVNGLPAAIHVYNASGVTNGVPYVQSSVSVQPGSYVDFVIEYYVTAGGAVPNPTLVVAVVASSQGGGAAVLGAGVHINRGLMLPDRTFLVEFATLSGRLYLVEYSSDLKTWNQVQPAITGNGSWIQWVDDGQPKTASVPSAARARFYRVILLP